MLHCVDVLLEVRFQNKSVFHAASQSPYLNDYIVLECDVYTACNFCTH